MDRFRVVKWKWYHFVVFWLPGGMFILASLIAHQLRNNNGTL